MNHRYVVIMAGGKGERFWPQSRLRRPKHLLPIVGDKPMLTQTLDRLEGLVAPKNTFVITNALQRDAVIEVCPQLPIENIVGEPVGRDTAAAVGLANVLVQNRDPEGVVAMLPADATIHDTEGFQRALTAAYEAAITEPCIVTVGIEPTFPATGYGYIQKGKKWLVFEELEACEVLQFVEKPDFTTAENYLASGQYFWNAGMFVFGVTTMQTCFREYKPGLAASLDAISEAIASGQTVDSVLAEQYQAIEKVSVDYAIMEPASADGRIVCVPSCFDWDDVGEWPAVARHCDADKDGNIIRGSSHIEGGTGNIVVTETNHTVALLGVSDLIVVQTVDATLICPRDKAQDIKQLVRNLGENDTGKVLM